MSLCTAFREFADELALRPELKLTLLDLLREEYVQSMAELDEQMEAIRTQLAEEEKPELQQYLSYLDSLNKTYKSKIIEINKGYDELSKYCQNRMEALEPKLERAREEEKVELEKYLAELRKVSSALADETPRGQPDSTQAQAFLDEFGTYFRDFNTLIYCLSDAPEGIKARKNELLVQVVANLSEEERETQIRKLPNESLRLMAKEIFEKITPENRVLSQQLIHLATYEQIRRAVKDASFTSVEDYTAWLKSLQNQLLKDRVLEGLADYKSVLDNQSIQSLIQTAHQRVFTSDNPFDWRSQKHIDCQHAERTLFQQLYFGQAERDSYAETLKTNLREALVTPRKDAEPKRFTELNPAYSGYFETRFLKTKGLIKTKEQDLRETVKEKVANAIAAGKSKWIESNRQDRHNQYNFIEKVINNEFYKPEIKVDKSGIVTLTFVDLFLKRRDVLNGFSALKAAEANLVPDNKVLNVFLDSSPEAMKLGFFPYSFKGNNLSEIEASIVAEKNAVEKKLKAANVKPEQKKLYEHQIAYLIGCLNYLVQIKKEYDVHMSKLSLAPNQRVLFGKLILFQPIIAERLKEFDTNGLIQNALTEIQKDLTDRDLQTVLKVDGLEQAVEEALKKIGEKKDVDLDRLILTKGLARTASVQVKKTLIRDVHRKASSTNERERILQALDNIWTDQKRSNESPEAFDQRREEALFHLFEAEYDSPDVKPVFNMSTEADETRLKENLKDMAQNAVRVINRTERGEPVLNGDEIKAYDAVMRQVATVLHTKKINMTTVSFKVKHGTTTCDVEVKTPERESPITIQVKIPRPLPYSLFKDAGEEDFSFSYGGSRGAEVLNAEFEQFYGAKQKGLGRYKGIAAGQQGFVKIRQAGVTGLIHATKKGHVRYCPLHQMAALPEDLSQYKDSYLFVGDNLHYVSPTAEIEQVPMLDLARFKSDLVEIAEGKPTVNLSQDQMELLIASNGGHRPPSTFAASPPVKFKKVVSRDDAMIERESRINQLVYGTETKTGFWVERDKARPVGELFAVEYPLRYTSLQPYARGETYQQTVRRDLARFRNTESAYHSPVERTKPNLQSLQQTLALSQAILRETEALSARGVHHNDIKPENFIYTRLPNGRYQVQFIDWATAAFETENFEKLCSKEEQDKLRKTYTDDAKYLEALFRKVWGANVLIDKSASNAMRCEGKDGSFVRLENGKVKVGVSPALQINRGGYHGTLPYLHPKSAVPGVLDLKVDAKDASLDDWAMMVMNFGLSKVDTFLTLSKGRNIQRYVIPGILESDGTQLIKGPKFDGSFLDAGHGLMYVPSTLEEGEPIHLYRRLKEMLEHLDDYVQDAGVKAEVTGKLSKFLIEIETRISQSQPWTQSEQLSKLNEIGTLIRKCEHVADMKDALARQERFNAVLDTLPNARNLNDLVKNGPPTDLEVLCTYPTQDPKDTQAVSEFIEKHGDWSRFLELFLKGNLLEKMIRAKQEDLIVALLTKSIPKDISHKAALLNPVKAQWFCHHLSELGMTPALKRLVEGLEKVGAEPHEVLTLLMERYNAAEAVSIHIPLHWETNVLETAIRVRDLEQLKIVTGLFKQAIPKLDDEQKATLEQEIKDALFLAASLGNAEAYAEVLEAYNKVSEEPITTNYLVSEPQPVPTYALLMKDRVAMKEINWAALQKNKALAKRFLNHSPSPLLMAITYRNSEGVNQLVRLGEQIGFTTEEWQALFEFREPGGESVLNRYLEHRDLDGFLAFLSEKIEQKCPEKAHEILVNYLKVDEVVNPLSRYLATQSSQDAPIQAIEVMGKLLDKVCAKADDQNHLAQKEREVILLQHKQWIINQAKQGKNHLALEKLLNAEGLSLHARVRVLKSLKEGAPEDVTFFKRMYDANQSLLVRSHEPSESSESAKSSISSGSRRPSTSPVLPVKPASIEDQLEAAAERLGEYINFVEALKGDLESKQAEIDAVAATQERAKKEVSESAAQIGFLNSQIAEQQNNIAELQARLSEVNTRRDEAAREFEFAQTQGDRERDELLETVGTLRAEESKLSDALKDAISKIEGLERQIKDEAQVYRQKSLDLSQQIEQQRALIQQQASALKEASEQKSKLEETLATKRSEWEASEQEWRELSDQYMAEVDKLRAGIAKAYKDLDSSRNAHEAAQGELIKTNDNLNQALQRFQLMLQHAESRLVEERQGEEVWLEVAHTLQKDLRDTIQKLGTSETKRVELEGRLTNLEAQIVLTAAQFEANQSELIGKIRDLNTAELSQDELKEEVHRLKVQLEANQARYDIEHETLKSEYQTALSQKEQLMIARMEAHRDEQAVLHQLISETQSKVASLEQVKEALETTQKNERDELQKAKKDLNQAREKEEQGLSVIVRLEQQVTQLSSSLDSVSVQHSDVDARLQNAIKQHESEKKALIENLSAQALQAQAQALDFERQLHEMKTGYEIQLAARSNELEALNQALSGAGEAKGVLEERIHHLTTDLRQAQTDHEAMRQALEARLENASVQYEEASRALKAVHDAVVEQLNRRIDLTANQAKEAESEVLRLNIELQTANEQLTALSQVQTKNEALESEIEQARNKVFTLQRDLDESRREHVERLDAAEAAHQARLEQSHASTQAVEARLDLLSRTEGELRRSSQQEIERLGQVLEHAKQEHQEQVAALKVTHQRALEAVESRQRQAEASIAELNQTIEQQEAEYTASVRTLTEQLNQARAKGEEGEATVTALRGELRELQNKYDADKATLSSQLQALQASSEAVKHDLQMRHEAEKTALKEQVQAAQAHSERLSAELNTLQSAHQAAESLLEALQTQFGELTEASEAVAYQFNQAQASIARLETTLEKTEQKLTEALEDKETALKALEEASKKERDELISQHRREQDKAQEKIEALDAALNTAKQRAEAAVDAGQELKTHYEQMVDTLKKELADFKKDQEQREANFEALLTAKEAEVAERTDLLGQAYEERMNVLEARAQSAEADVQRSEAELAVVRQEAALAHEKVSDLESQAATTEEEKKALQDKLNKAESEIGKLALQEERLKAENGQALNKYQAHVQRLVASTAQTIVGLEAEQRKLIEESREAFLTQARESFSKGVDLQVQAEQFQKQQDRMQARLEALEKQLSEKENEIEAYRDRLEKPETASVGVSTEPLDTTTMKRQLDELRRLESERREALIAEERLMREVLTMPTPPTQTGPLVSPQGLKSYAVDLAKVGLTVPSMTVKVKDKDHTIPITDHPPLILNTAFGAMASLNVWCPGTRVAPKISQQLGLDLSKKEEFRILDRNDMKTQMEAMAQYIYKMFQKGVGLIALQEVPIKNTEGFEILYKKLEELDKDTKLIDVEGLQKNYTKTSGVGFGMSMLCNPKLFQLESEATLVLKGRGQAFTVKSVVDGATFQLTNIHGDYAQQAATKELVETMEGFVLGDANLKTPPLMMGAGFMAVEKAQVMVDGAAVTLGTFDVVVDKESTKYYPKYIPETDQIIQRIPSEAPAEAPVHAPPAAASAAAAASSEVHEATAAPAAEVEEETQTPLKVYRDRLIALLGEGFERLDLEQLAYAPNRQAFEDLIKDHLEECFRFKRPFIHEAVKDSIQEALDGVCENREAFEVIKDAAGRLHVQKQDLEQEINEAEIETLQQLLICYSDQQLQQVGLFDVYALPEKILSENSEGTLQRLSRAGYIRKLALIAFEKKLEERRESVFGPSSMVSLSMVSLTDLQKEDKAAIQAMKAIRSPLEAGNIPFFNWRKSFSAKAERFLNEPFDWLSPAFRASSADYAKEMQARYQSLAKEAEVMITALSAQYYDVKARLDSLPTEETLLDAANSSTPEEAKTIKDVLKHRNYLRQELESIEKQLTVSREVYDKLYGTGEDPQKTHSFVTTNGLIETLTEAVSMLPQHSRVTYKDYPLTEKQAFLKGQKVGEVTDLSFDSQEELQREGTQVYKEIAGIAEKQFRVYEIGYVDNKTHKQDYARFMEESTHNGGETDRVTLLKFPVGSGNDEIKIQVAMDMAVQILRKFTGVPSKDNKILIRGRNPEELKYLTAAVLALGEMGGKKFGKEAIRLLSSSDAFNSRNWEEQLGVSGVFTRKAHSFYKQFKADEHVKKLEKLAQEVCGKKLTSETVQEKLKVSEKEISKTSRQFKARLNGKTPQGNPPRGHP